jgi:hypothetical protein
LRLTAAFDGVASPDSITLVTEQVLDEASPTGVPAS